MNDNRVLMVDSYKSSHYKQFPPGMTSMYSYIESRGGRWPETVFFGLQYWLLRYMQDAITEEEVVEAAEFFEAHGEPFNMEGWMYIVDALDGRLPVRIRAVPEGLVVPTNNVLVDIESTDHRVPWIATWLETALLRAVWYPTTVATQSWWIKKTIRDFMEKTSDEPKGTDFMLHDFGARGVSSHESAGIGGAAHLVNFMGSDTVEAVMLIRKYYGEKMAAFSVPATEHSTMTAWGRHGEAAAYAHALAQFQTSPILSIVSDSYDIWNALENIWSEELREQVEAFPGHIVIRFDSGKPVDRVILRGLEMMAEAFGTYENQMGYRVINKLRALQGDGINSETIWQILSTITNAGFSAENIATFGMGGALLQDVTRDTQQFACKCSSVEINGVRRDVYKQPVDDVGKRSKKGRLDLVYERGLYRTVEHGDSNTLLQPVYENGDVLRIQTFGQIRELATTKQPPAQVRMRV